MKVKILFALCCLVVVFNQNLRADTMNEKIEKRRVGQLTFISLQDVPTDMGINLVLNSNVQVVKEIFAGNNSLPASINTFLVQINGKNILIDSGTNSGNIAKNLNSIGINPENIDAILLTHMHGDHIGGLIDNAGSKVFKNADIFVSKDELDYWVSTARAILPISVKKLYDSRIKFLEWGKNIFTEIKAVKAVGHTPGHTAFEITSNGEKLLVIGDLMHIVALQTADPSFSITYDIDPNLAAKTRAEILKYAYENNIIIAGMHVPFGGVGKLTKDVPPRLYKLERK
ncbi:MAG: MBL fold metallo-hydrolase [Elusimicrobiota bacterium]|jgi:glyoxylase-like metal-dependent hydrolase (beta-lactamase superfamily II)|nr:MBL fold metallo-hydrolase [Elusimicrobiota bacterium]